MSNSRAFLTVSWFALTLLLAGTWAWDLNNRLDTLELTNQELVWSWRQVTFVKVENISAKTDFHPENTAAHSTAQYAHSLIAKADLLLNKNEVRKALPILRQAGYEAEKAENQLKCGKWLCDE